MIKSGHQLEASLGAARCQSSFSVDWSLSVKRRIHLRWRARSHTHGHSEFLSNLLFTQLSCCILYKIGETDSSFNLIGTKVSNQCSQEWMEAGRLNIDRIPYTVTHQRGSMERWVSVFGLGLTSRPFGPFNNFSTFNLLLLLLFFFFF